MVRAAALFMLLSASGCGKKSDPVAAGDPDSAPPPVTESKTEEGLVRQQVDLDADGRTDVFNYFRERANAPRLLIRREVDLNRDGILDVVTYFDDDGALEREEMDSDFDGQVDWWDHYENGRRVMSEWDTDYDGDPNVWTYYDDGKVQRKERDTDGDGKIDLWERFDGEGNVIKTGRDLDGDGKIDERDE